MKKGTDFLKYPATAEYSVGWKWFFSAFCLFKPETSACTTKVTVGDAEAKTVYFLSKFLQCTVLHIKDAHHIRDKHFYQILFLKNSPSPFSFLIFALICDRKRFLTEP